MTSIRDGMGDGIPSARIPEPEDAPDVDVRATGTRSRRSVASFARYDEAERAVGQLHRRKFPVKRAAIVGRGVQLVEQITGPLDQRPFTRAGTLVGALIGGMTGWIIGVFELTHPFVTGTIFALYGLLFGGIAGLLVGLVVYAVQRWRRAFSSYTTMQPERFELLVDDEAADEAARLLAQWHIPEPRVGEPSAPAVT